MDLNALKEEAWEAGGCSKHKGQYAIRHRNGEIGGTEAGVIVRVGRMADNERRSGQRDRQ